MTFDDLKAMVAALDATFTSCTGSKAIEDITVEEPNGPEDELYFIKLVHWAFVLFNEAGALSLRELARSLKSSEPQESKRFDTAKHDIDALRTAVAHNMPADKANQHKRARVEAWFLDVGGEPRDWKKCCEKLMLALGDMLALLTNAFHRITHEAEDRAEFVIHMHQVASKHWPVHHFDQMVTEAAISLGIEGLDAVSFRKKNQEKWQQLATMFQTPQEARVAVARIVKAELKALFGNKEDARPLVSS